MGWSGGKIAQGWLCEKGCIGLYKEKTFAENISRRMDGGDPKM